MLSYWPPCPQGRGQCPARRRCPGHAPRIFPENRGLAGPPTEVPACLIRHPDKPRPSLGSVSVCGTGRAASLADFTWLRSSHTGRWSGQRGRVRMRAPGRRPCRASLGAGGPRCRPLCAGRNADSTEAPHADGTGRPAGLFLNVGRSGGHERGPRHPSWLAPRTAARPNARSEAQHAPDAPAVPTARPLPPGFQGRSRKKAPLPRPSSVGALPLPGHCGDRRGPAPAPAGRLETDCGARDPARPRRAWASVRTHALPTAAGRAPGWARGASRSSPSLVF